jgi:hypothetical protein
MHTIKAYFDGKSIRVPKAMGKVPPGEVVVVFEHAPAREEDRASWLKAQEAAFAKVWDNDEDAVYDAL